MDRLTANALVHGVFDTWGPCLARHAWRATGDRAMADDLVQEAFLALYKELRAGREIDNPRAWTLTVVRHYAARRLRDCRRRGEELTAPEDFDVMAGPQAPPCDDNEELLQLLSVLSEREEEVVLLRMECFKYREIAGQLGISAKTVATLLARAVKKLQHAFAHRDEIVSVARKESNAHKPLQ